MSVASGSVNRALPDGVRTMTTLSRGRFRLPYRVVGRYRALQAHDWLTARWLDRHVGEVDLVHCWPGAARRTIEAARRHGIPSLIERPNAHTGYAFETAAEESRRCGIELPAGHDHAYDGKSLDHELGEYEACDFLLCPSDFVRRTFVERGLSPDKLLRHQYGFDETRFRPETENRSAPREGGLVAMHAGVCEPRKGLHYALEAWIASEASGSGEFRICGGFVPGYRERLEPLLAHPSVRVLGHRTDLPELMRDTDLFVIASVEEGSALVTYEARGSGCVLLASDASGAVGTHEVDALLHPMRDVKTLTEHLDRVHRDRALLAGLRQRSLAERDQLTWGAAGGRLAGIYRDVMAKWS